VSGELVPVSDAPGLGGGALENLPTGGGHVVASRGDAAGRKAYIQSVMREDISRYYAEGLDREYLGLLMDETGTRPAFDPMDAELSRQMMSATPEGAQLVREWDNMGGFRLHLGRVQERVGGIVRDLGDDRHQRAFMEWFDRILPEGVRYAIYDEIAMGPPSWVPEASKEDLEHFASDPVGADLLAEWGAEAGWNVTRLWQRVDRLKQHLGGDADKFLEWIDTLKPAELKAILRAVVKGA
jgi:hypothetical protein